MSQCENEVKKLFKEREQRDGHWSKKWYRMPLMRRRHQEMRGIPLSAGMEKLGA